MPLYIDGVVIEEVPDIDTFAEQYGSYFSDSSQELLKQPVTEVGPKGLLYIGQREVGGSSPRDDVISVLGSEDATTCHIAVLRHTGSGSVSMCHFDGCAMKEGLESMVSVIKDQTEDFASGRLELHLVGGFLDPQRNSHQVSDELLGILCSSSYDLHLVTACITHFNTTTSNEKQVPFPVIYGLACDIKTGRIFRARFPDKGPDLAMRGARHFSDLVNMVVYDNKTQQLVIGPFDYRPLPHLDIFMSMPDHQLRKYLSTSPEQEPEGFELSVRASLAQMKNFPDPLVSVFKGKPRTYRKVKDTGAWVSTTQQ